MRRLWLLRALAAILAVATVIQPEIALADEDDASVVGSTIIDGKRVELLNDQTWRYLNLPNIDGKCVPINAILTFCGSILDWKPTSTRNSEFLRLFSSGARNQAGIIYEAIGSADGLDMENYRSVIIEGAAIGAGVPMNEVPVLDVRDTLVDDVPGETVIYGAKISGLNFVFVNSFVLARNHAIQFMTFSISKDLTSEHEKLHQDFIDDIRITFPDGQI